MGEGLGSPAVVLGGWFGEMMLLLSLCLSGLSTSLVLSLRSLAQLAVHCLGFFTWLQSLPRSLPQQSRHQSDQNGSMRLLRLQEGAGSRKSLSNTDLAVSHLTVLQAVEGGCGQSLGGGSETQKG